MLTLHIKKALETYQNGPALTPFEDLRAADFFIHVGLAYCKCKDGDTAVNLHTGELVFLDFSNPKVTKIQYTTIEGVML